MKSQESIKASRRFSVAVHRRGDRLIHLALIPVALVAGIIVNIFIFAQGTIRFVRKVARWCGGVWRWLRKRKKPS